MQKSVPGKKLSPQLKAVLDPIYNRDPKRYANLCRFVWTMQKRGWEDEAIAEVFRLADKNLDAVGEWWIYLTALMMKAKAAAVARESDNHKTQIGEIADEFVEFLRAKRLGKDHLSHSEAVGTACASESLESAGPDRPKSPSK